MVFCQRLAPGLYLQMQSGLVSVLNEKDQQINSAFLLGISSLAYLTFGPPPLEKSLFPKYNKITRYFTLLFESFQPNSLIHESSKFSKYLMEKTTHASDIPPVLHFVTLLLHNHQNLYFSQKQPSAWAKFNFLGHTPNYQIPSERKIAPNHQIPLQNCHLFCPHCFHSSVMLSKIMSFEIYLPFSNCFQQKHCLATTYNILLRSGN